jgi:uncharacterized membrane protein YfcA
VQKLIVLGFVGLLAQLIDGALGMAYGATSTTLLLAAGVAPAAASASVHLAEIGTTIASGASHWRFGNVDWRTVKLLALPGAVGAFLGAVALSSVSAAVAEPFIACFLFALGAYILIRFSRPRKTPIQRPRRQLPWFCVTPLGGFAGFMDAAGGGGWGPIGTPALLSSGRIEPRKVVGSVDTSEVLVAVGASIGFLVSLSFSELNAAWVGALLVGGLFAAPIAAWLVRALPARVLGSAVGGLILVTNLQTVAEYAGLGGWPLVAGYVVLFALWALAVGHAITVNRREARQPGELQLETA